jgi:DNA-binding NarL/FixJ family response regulator
MRRNGEAMRTIEESARGSRLLPSSAWEHLSETLRLSPREMQVVRAVFDDWKEESIARELGISRHTVNTYFRRLYSKLRVSSRPQLIVRIVAQYMALAAIRQTVPMSPRRVTDEPVTGRKLAASA